MTLTDPELSYLKTQRIGRLATVASDGTVQNNPVGFRYNPETATVDIYGLNMGATRKFRNVESNPSVALVIDDVASLDPWKVRGVEIRGAAVALRGQRPPTATMSGEVIRISPRRVISWNIDPANPGMQARTATGESSSHVA
jgi:pyridoxamine 5'-phosphate oxidase family protein